MLKYHRMLAEQTRERIKGHYYIAISGLFYLLTQEFYEERESGLESVMTISTAPWNVQSTSQFQFSSQIQGWHSNSMSMISKHNQSIEELQQNRNALRPVQLPMGKLISPDVSYDRNDVFQEIYALRQGAFLTLDKSSFLKIIAHDMLQMRQYPIFQNLPDAVFRKLYQDMIPQVITMPNQTIYNFGDSPQSMFLVKQGQLIEEHEVPFQEEQTVFCRYYRAGQWFGNQELFIDSMYPNRITRVLNYSQDYHGEPLDPKKKAYQRTLKSLKDQKEQREQKSASRSPPRPKNDTELTKELISLCNECRLLHFEAKEVEPYVTVLLELKMASIIGALEQCKGFTKKAMEQILRPFTDTQPGLVLSDDGKWVAQTVMFPEDPECSVKQKLNNPYESKINVSNPYDKKTHF